MSLVEVRSLELCSSTKLPSKVYPVLVRCTLKPAIWRRRHERWRRVNLISSTQRPFLHTKRIYVFQRLLYFSKWLKQHIIFAEPDVTFFEVWAEMCSQYLTRGRANNEGPKVHHLVHPRWTLNRNVFKNKASCFFLGAVDLIEKLRKRFSYIFLDTWSTCPLNWILEVNFQKGDTFLTPICCS